MRSTYTTEAYPSNYWSITSNALISVHGHKASRQSRSATAAGDSRLNQQVTDTAIYWPLRWRVFPKQGNVWKLFPAASSMGIRRDFDLFVLCVKLHIFDIILCTSSVILVFIYPNTGIYLFACVCMCRMCGAGGRGNPARYNNCSGLYTHTIILLLLLLYCAGCVWHGHKI